MRNLGTLLALVALVAACGHADSDPVDDTAGSDPAITDGQDASASPAAPAAKTRDGGGDASAVVPRADGGTDAAPSQPAPLPACNGNEDEPNGGLILADDLAAGDVLCGQISSANDTDWFAFETNKPWTVQFESKDAKIVVRGSGATAQEATGTVALTGGKGSWSFEIHGAPQSYKIAR